jgi:phosphatidylglycerol:prolipoprotein diacylglycerol transferase
MLSYPNIDPEIVRVGPLAVRWYGMMYLIGFIAAYLLVRYQIRERALPVGKEFVESLFSYLIIGLLIGARLGYVVFYNLSYYLQHPLEVLAVWQGGMSFHGGLIGSVIAGFLFCRRYKADFWQTADLVIVTAPIGIGLGRIGNFINGELYGRVTNSPLAMIFPTDPQRLPRHPSQLYEAFLEGLLLFLILWLLRNREFKTGILTALFIGLYGLFRFTVEFFREPDSHIGYFFGYFTLGQLLCLFMIIVAIGIYRLRSLQGPKPHSTS